MMDDFGKRYARLRERLLIGRANGSLGGAHEDQLLEEMDAVWWKMTQAEREHADRTLPLARRLAEIAAEVLTQPAAHTIAAAASYQNQIPGTRVLANKLSGGDATLFRVSVRLATP